MGIDPMNKISIIIRILFVITLFEHSPLIRRVFFSSIMRERERTASGRRKASSISSWLAYL
jgi:hypothetical protein